MKKHVLCNVALVLCAVLVLALFAAVPAALPTQAATPAGNVLAAYNANFEGADNAGMPENWSIKNGKSSDVGVATEGSDKLLHLKPLASPDATQATKNVLGVISTKVDITGWTSIEAIVDYKCDTTVEAQIFFFFYNENEEEITRKQKYVAGTGDWEMLSFSTTVPDGTKYAALGLYKTSSGANASLYYNNAEVYNASTMTFEYDRTEHEALKTFGWNTNGNVNLSIVNDAAKGSKVLKVETNGAGSKYATSPLVYVKGLTDIRVTFDIKGSHRTWTYLRQFNSNKVSLGNVSGFSSSELWNQMKDGNGNPKNEWVTVTLTATVTADTEYVSLWIPYVGADCTDGVFYLDNIKIEHNHTFDKKVATEEYFASGATTTQAAQYYKSCACGAKGTETFSVGDPLPTQATTAPATTAPATTAPATTAPAGTTAPATTAGTTATTAGTTSATTPETGDTTSTIGMMAVLLLAVTGMVAMLVGNKKGLF